MELYEIIFIIVLVPFALGFVGFCIASVVIVLNFVLFLIKGVRGKL